MRPSTLEVRLGPTRVGWLEYFEEGIVYRFSFDDEWLANPRRPILGQIFEDLRPDDIVTSGMLCWFHHILPQGYLRQFLARKLGVDESEEFAILGAGGADLPGAVVLNSAEDRIPRGQPVAPRAVTDDDAPRDELSLAFSLAGMQWKLSVREGERGLVIPARGQAGHWIAKFHDPRFEGLPRLEHATMQLASACGIEVPEVRLVSASTIAALPEEIPTGDGSVYLIRRFDRASDDPETRIHIEDFAQVIDRPRPFDASYEEVAAVLARLAPQDVDEWLLRLVFCILVGNGDAHLKNWSLRYPDGRKPRLAPAYDIIPTVVYFHRRESLALSLGGRRELEALTLDRFDDIALWTDRESTALYDQIRRYAEQVAAAWRAHADSLGFTPAQRERISAHMDEVRRRWAP